MRCRQYECADIYIRKQRYQVLRQQASLKRPAPRGPGSSPPRRRTIRSHCGWYRARSACRCPTAAMPWFPSSSRMLRHFPASMLAPMRASLGVEATSVRLCSLSGKVVGETQAYDAAGGCADEVDFLDVQLVHNPGDVGGQFRQRKPQVRQGRRPRVSPHVEPHHRTKPSQGRHPGPPAMQVPPGRVVQQHRLGRTPRVGEVIYVKMELVTVHVQYWHTLTIRSRP